MYDRSDGQLDEDGWNKWSATELPYCIFQEAWGVSMEPIVWDKGPQLYKLGQLIDKIGWRRYMEGMISSEALAIQAECVDLGGCSLSLDNWAQWLYRNMFVHDTVNELKAVQSKEELQR